MEVIVEPAGTIVAVTGEVDLFAAPALGRALLSAVDSGRAVLIDLCGCSFMDSSGLQEILMAQRWATTSDVPIEVACEHGSAVHRLFQMVLPQVPVHPSRDVALASG